MTACPVCGSYEARTGAWRHAQQCVECGTWRGVSLGSAGPFSWAWPRAAEGCPVCGCLCFWNWNPYADQFGCVQCGSIIKAGQVIRYGGNLGLPLKWGWDFST